MWYSVCRCVQDTYPSFRAQTLWPYFTWCHHLLWLFSNFITELCWLWCHHHHHHHHPSISMYFHLYPSMFISLWSHSVLSIVCSPGRAASPFIPGVSRTKTSGRRLRGEVFRQSLKRGMTGVKRSRAMRLKKSQWLGDLKNRFHDMTPQFFWISHMPPLGFWGISSLMQWGDWWSSHHRAG